MKPHDTFSKVQKLIEQDLPVAAPDLVTAGYVSRPTLWRMERAGLPVTRIGRRIFVRFSDLTAFQNPTGVAGKNEVPKP